MIEVYIYGCPTCGVNSIYLKRLQRVHGQGVVYNSTRNDNLQKHIEYLNKAGIEDNGYPSIIVVDSGKRILRLEEWKSL